MINIIIHITKLHISEVKTNKTNKSSTTVQVQTTIFSHQIQNFKVSLSRNICLTILLTKHLKTHFLISHLAQIDKTNTLQSTVNTNSNTKNQFSLSDKDLGILFPTPVPSLNIPLSLCQCHCHRPLLPNKGFYCKTPASNISSGQSMSHPIFLHLPTPPSKNVFSRQETVMSALGKW